MGRDLTRPYKNYYLSSVLLQFPFRIQQLGIKHCIQYLTAYITSCDFDIFLQHLKNCCTLEDLQRPSNLLVQFSHIAVEGLVVGEGVLNRLDQQQHPTACVHTKMDK